MQKKTSGTPQGLFTYAVIGERGGNNTTSYRSWIPPEYQAPCTWHSSCQASLTTARFPSSNSAAQREDTCPVTESSEDLGSWSVWLKAGCFTSHSPRGNSGKADPADSSGTHGFVGLLGRGSKGRWKGVGLTRQCSRLGCHVRVKSHHSIIASALLPKQWLGTICCSRCWEYGSEWDLVVGSVGGQWKWDE